MPAKPSRDWPAVLKDAKERGLHAAAVAREQKVSHVCVHKQCDKHGVELPRHPGGPSGKVQPNWRDALREAKANNISFAEFAALHGVSKPAVSKFSSQYGIKLRGQFPITGRAA